MYSVLALLSNKRIYIDTLVSKLLVGFWRASRRAARKLSAVSLFMTSAVIVANIAHSATSKEFQGCLSEEAVLNPILTQNMW